MDTPTLMRTATGFVAWPRRVLAAEAWPDTLPSLYRSEGFAEDLCNDSDLGPACAAGAALPDASGTPETPSADGPVR